MEYLLIKVKNLTPEHLNIKTRILKKTVVEGEKMEVFEISNEKIPKN